MKKNISDKLVLAIRTALFWAVTQRVVVINYRRFGTTYRFHLQGTIRVKILFGLLTFETGTDGLYRNVGKKIPLLAV